MFQYHTDDKFKKIIDEFILSSSDNESLDIIKEKNGWEKFSNKFRDDLRKFFKINNKIYFKRHRF